MAESKELIDFLTKQSAAYEALMIKFNREKEGDPDNSIQRLMDSVANSITEFVFDPLNGDIFNKWYARHEDSFLIDGAKLDDAARVRIMLRKLDSNSHSKYIDFILPKKANEKTFEETVNILKVMFGEPDSLFSIRYNCLKLMKKQSDDYITFASLVNKECERFKFTDLKLDQFKCLIFICGLQAHDKDIRTRLLMKLESVADITLPKLTAECKRLLDLKADSDLITPKSSTTLVPQVTKVSKKPKNQNKPKSVQTSSNTHNTDKNKPPKRPCWLCGEVHWVKDCPYSKRNCKDCGTVGHKEGFCEYDRSKQAKKYSNPKKQIFNTKGLFATSSSEIASRRKFIFIKINNRQIKLQVDTASDITVISMELYDFLGRPSSVQCTELANSASGHRMSLKLEFDCQMIANGMEAPVTVYVSDTPNLNLFGLDCLHLFGLMDLPLNAVCGRIQQLPEDINQQKFFENLQRNFSSVFNSSVGSCTKTKAVLRLKSEATPVFRPSRPVPYAALPLVDAELERLKQEGVITSVAYSEWAAPIVITKKPNGSIRMCADFSTGLNDALEKYEYPLPTSDSIFASLNGGKYFSKIDLADAFLQVLVDDGSKKYLTINTHKGLFQYNRIPFGIKIASAMFQQIVDAMIAGLKRTCGFMDDVLVNGRTIEEHNLNLLALFERIKEWGFHVRLEKCKFLMTEVHYLGFIIDKNGRRPDKSKITAICNMPEPHDVSTVRSFLGMLNYYSQFVKEMRDLRYPLDQLLCKDVKFEWSNECRKAFNRAKQILQSDLLLTHYDPNLDLIVAADASLHGIGAVILHRFPDGSQKAIEHASRTLTPAEKNYGQIEKEALSLVFAIKKFHKMIWGRSFTLQTDHQPLLAIFGSKKGIPVHTSSRLQRWALTLMPYDFKIEFIKTDKFGHADVLSRLIENRQSTDETMVIASVQLMEQEIERILVDAIRMLPVTAEMIQQASAGDELLSNVMKYLRTSWPTKIICEEEKILYNRRESLAEKSGCLLFNDRVIVPSILRTKVLNHLHLAHPGIVRMKALARSFVYWPNIDKDVSDWVQKCSRCASTARAPVKSELYSWPKASEVWSRVHIDYAGPFQGHNYLVIVDSFSKWPEIFIMTSTTSAATITKIRELIGRFGLMAIIVSDNGTQFTSHEFDEFCKSEGICHIPTPPAHPQSNGQAERFVDTFKRALNKAKGEENVAIVLQRFLQRYRITPNAQLPNNCTPAEIMLGRKMKSSLDLLKPVEKIEFSRDTKMEMDFNLKHGAKQRIFEPKQRVFVRDFRGGKTIWSPGEIIERIGSVIYTIGCDGMVWRRHTNQIRARYSDDDGQSDPTLSLLLDTFDIMDQPIQSTNDQNSLLEIDHNDQPNPTEVITSPPNSEIPISNQNVGRHSQRKRQPPVRTNFSKSIGGRYVDI